MQDMQEVAVEAGILGGEFDSHPLRVALGLVTESDFSDSSDSSFFDFSYSAEDSLDSDELSWLSFK